MRSGLRSLPFLSITLLFATFLLSAAALAQNVSERFNPKQQEDREHSLGRDEWIEQMHRTEPGINWRVIERENQEARRTVQALSEKSGVNAPSILTEDTVADVLRGRWLERGSHDQTGRIVDADVDFRNGVIYAASAGGNVWKGNMDGTGWRSLNDRQRFADIVMVRYFELSGQSAVVLLHNAPASAEWTTDNGNTWHQGTGLDSIARWGSFRRAVVVNSGFQFYALGKEWDYQRWQSVITLYSSLGGVSAFHNVLRVDGEVNHCNIWGSPLSNSIMMLREDSLFQIGSDGTQSLVSIIDRGMAPEDVRNEYLVGTVSGKDTVLYCFIDNESESHCHISYDGGRTWSYRGNTVRPYSPNGIAVSNASPDQIFLGGVECFRSYDAGSSWGKHDVWWAYYDDPAGKLHADIFAIRPFTGTSGEEFVLIGTDGGLYISNDAIQTVSNLSLNGLNVGQYYSTYTRRDDGGSLLAGSQDQGLQYAGEDAGGVLDFDQIISGDYGHLTSGDGGRTIWCNYPGFSMFRPENNKQMVSWDFTGQGQLWLPPIVADPDTPTVAYVVNDSVGGSYLWRLRAIDTAVIAERLPFDFSGVDHDRTIGAIAISPIDHHHRYVLTTSGVFLHSSDGGVNWNESTGLRGPSGHYFYGSSIVPSPTKLGRVYIGGSGYSNPGAFVSNDDGATFDSIAVGLPSTLIYSMDIDSKGDFLFAATEAGPYLYDVGRNRWFDMAATSAPQQTYWSVEYVDALHTARFGTYGRGIWDFTIDQQASGVEADDDITSTKSIALHAAPNPMRSSTSISFEMPQGAPGRVRVYDITGRVVRDLFEGQLAPGHNSFEWDGHSTGGYDLPAGSYLVVLNTLGGVHHVKVELAR